MGGDSAVGKSSLVLRFVRGQFFEYQESTIGAAFLTQNVSLNDYTVKYDLASKRKVDTEEAKEYAKDNGLFFMETSAKTATNVEELFKAIAKKLPKDPYKETHEANAPVDLSG